MKSTFIALLLVLTIGCQNTSEKEAGPAPAPAEGSSSGGGSFGNESSIQILKWASEDLARQIRNSSPELYVNLPAGWDRERLAQTIESVDMANFPEVSRYGIRLMFDYGVRADGSQYITATQLFADAYSAHEVNSKKKHDFYYSLEEVKLKLAHETAHLMGLGLTKETDFPEARDFAESLMRALDSDNIECVTTEDAPLDLFVHEGFPADINKARAYVFNRPTGRGVSPSSYSNRFSLIKGFPMIRNSLEKFGVGAVQQVIEVGQRFYSVGKLDDPFSWNDIDLRLTTRDEVGFKSNYNWKMPDAYIEYMDFDIVTSDVESLYVSTIPMENQESPTLRLSRGSLSISMRFENGKVVSPEMIMFMSFRAQGATDSVVRPHYPTYVNIPIACTRDFFPVEVVRK